MKKNNQKAAYIIIPLILIASAVSFFFFLQSEKSMCGDGICTQKEVDYCIYDCKEECKTSASNEYEICSTGWQTAYFLQVEDNSIPSEYLKETDIIDFSNPRIQEVAKSLKRETAKETAKAILTWTHNNIRYDGTNSYYDCLGDKSSDIIERGWGLCSTMTKVNLALLRANGIASYPVTGCWSRKGSCFLIQSFFQFKLPKIEPLMADAEGFYVTKGGLHNYLMIYLPVEGWVKGESTAGMIFDNNCINYLPYEENPIDKINCGLSKFNQDQMAFIEECKKY